VVGCQGKIRDGDAFAAAAVDRDTHVVAVGGGVTGDLAGFVAEPAKTVF